MESVFQNSTNNKLSVLKAENYLRTKIALESPVRRFKYRVHNLSVKWLKRLWDQ